MKITDSEIEAFLDGSCASGSAVWLRIIDDLTENPNGAVAQFIDKRSRESHERASDRYQKLWDHVMGPLIQEIAVDELPGEFSANASSSFEDLDRYWDLQLPELMSELSDSELLTSAAHRGDEDPLDPYLDSLRIFVCETWNWKERRHDPSLQDEKELAKSLTSALIAANLELPASASLVAVILVKAGLDRLCGG